MERNDLGHVIAATATDIDAMDWIADPDRPGVRHKVLWQSGATVLGLMEIAPGGVNPEHTHHGAHHHILILSGNCTMLGRDMDEGSYLYIPPGVPHEAANTGDAPCTFFYTYRPVEIPPADDPLIIA
ncbi:MAG: cupin domain-containing protein [Candidatus Nanopelagicales bacterium]